MKVAASLSPPLELAAMDIYLGIGSNLGERRSHLGRAVAALATAGFEIDTVSPVVESPAMLPEGAPADWNRPYLNAAVRCRAALAPEAALDALKSIEADFGRNFSARWAPRPIDLDILLWGDEEVRTERLTIPHPGLAARNFVLAPLVALDPALTVPGIGRSVLELSRALPHRIPLWMGIVNLTPDSFSDGGETMAWEAVERRVDTMIDDGAEIIDLGAESTRPGAAPLTAEQEWSRLEPILSRLVAKLGAKPLRPRISIDTYHASVARRALAFGADIINDVGGLTSPAMLDVAAASSAQFVAMHSLTVPADPSITLPADRNPVDEVLRWLDARRREWDAAGIAASRILFDPGIGFGKNPLQSLELLRNVRRFHGTGLRCLVGHSRKSFMAGFTKEGIAGRDLFTIGASLNLCAQGVDVIRVHEVAAHVGAYRGWAHLLTN
jgi:2-amino-4-hydroxy-6-hydroxymethyldihydropteridine diphosphokinase / dihydropteroate synthase